MTDPKGNKYRKNKMIILFNPVILSKKCKRREKWQKK